MTYGSQEGLVRGYIPKRCHAQSSYAPVLSGEGRSGLSLGMELRAENVHSCVRAGEPLDHLLDNLPSSILASRTRLRLAGAFSAPRIVESLENQAFGHVDVVRLYQRLMCPRVPSAGGHREALSGSWRARLVVDLAPVTEYPSDGHGGAPHPRR
jgi:hypothetical protein